MRILHLCLANYYIDGYNYQENVLTRINKEDGHEVRIIASTETFKDNLTMTYVEPSEYVTEFGVPIQRIPYVKIGTHFSTVKIRKYVGLYDEIVKFAPDVILSHDIVFLSIFDVIRYKKEHPEVKLYADTHTGIYNSGTNWLSLHVLHRCFYRYLIHRTLPYLEKYFYISSGERDFAKEHYVIPDEMLEFYPLGGDLPTEEEYRQRRTARRAELGLAPDELLLVHSGKITSLKRADELLKALAAVPELKAKLAIMGSISDDMKPVLEPLMKADDRVVYLGWKSASDLLEYLCACDLYCQPGSLSATLQNAVCCGSPIMSYPHPAYTEALDYGNILWVDTQEDMERTFRALAAGKVDLDELRRNSGRCAREVLDYRVLAARIYR